MINDDADLMSSNPEDLMSSNPEDLMSSNPEDLMSSNPEGPKRINLDYTLQTAEERTALVIKICTETPPEELTPYLLEKMANYIIFPIDKEERKKFNQDKSITSENRRSTLMKHETSFQGLASTLENGEDGIYNMMIPNDKNIIFMPKVSITEKDIAEIPALKSLVDSIHEVEATYKAATGRRKYLLLQQLKQMRQDQYVIKSAYRRPMYFMNAKSSLAQVDIPDLITVDGEMVYDHSLVSLMNPEHVSALLCNYSRLKEESYGHFWNDAYYLMQDLEDLVAAAVKDPYPIYYKVMVYKIDGKSNAEIQQLLRDEDGITYSIEYLSSLWRNKIPKMIAEAATSKYLDWYYTERERGSWKRCSRCGQIKLANHYNFSKNKTSKDGWYSICKQCRARQRRVADPQDSTSRRP